MKTAILFTAFSALAASVSAYCPNLCSGHGTCGDKDTCTCYSYAGTTRGDSLTVDRTGASSTYNNNKQSAWTGPDCSLRTCPLAYSFSGATPVGLGRGVVSANTDQNGLTFDLNSAVALPTNLDADSSLTVGSKVRIVNSAGAGYIRTLRAINTAMDDIAVYGPAVPGTSSGTVTVYFGLGEDDSVDHDSDVGADDYLYSNKAAGGAHSLLECAGQGLCDRATGECDCFPGYEGEACTRTVCPNSCSGHGICLAAHRLAADAAEDYGDVWDSNKHFGCKCDAGFRGPDCSLQECASDFDPLHGCGGGPCNEGNLDSEGEDCPNKTFSDCSTNEQRDCSGRGLCDYETGICKCFSGFYGEACNSQTILI